MSYRIRSSTNGTKGPRSQRRHRGGKFRLGRKPALSDYGEDFVDYYEAAREHFVNPFTPRAFTAFLREQFVLSQEEAHDVTGIFLEQGYLR